MRIEYYSTKQERKTLLDAAVLLGESVINDDFIDIDNNPTDGNSGRLTFDIKPNPVKSADQILEEQLRVKLDAKTITSTEIIDYLRLKFIKGV